MALRQTSRWGRGPCYEGEINGYSVLVLATDSPSGDGIGSGRIEQLHIGMHSGFDVRYAVLAYRKEWFGPPPMIRKLREVVEHAVRQIDGKSVNWEDEVRRYDKGLRG